MAELGQTAITPITSAQAELINAGFRPSRQAWAVRFVRHLIWPLVRPFHFHNLEKTQLAIETLARLERDLRSFEPWPSVSARLEKSEAASIELAHKVSLLENAVAHSRLDRMEIRLDALEYSVGQLAAYSDASRDDTTKRQEIASLEMAAARTRSELTAIANRQFWTEGRASNAIERADELANTISNEAATLKTQIADLSSQLAGHTSQLSEFQARLGDHEASQAEHGAEQRIVQRGVFLAHAKDGLFVLQAGELISEAVRQDGTWDAHIIEVAEYAAAAIRKRNGKLDNLLAIDVGGHFGLMSVPLARIFGRVITFEPNAFNATLLRANIVLNGLDANVDVRGEALAATDGIVSLAPDNRQEVSLPFDEHGNYAPQQGSNLGAYSFVAHGTGISEAKSLSLDSLALERVAFIKIDVQGADGTVVLGAMNTIVRCRPWVVFEWEQRLSANFDVTFETVEKAFRGAGYHLSVLRRHNPKQTDYLAIPEDEANLRPALTVEEQTA